ncbi:MAG: UDP-N-acetylmuramate--L-alanine ligase [Candidatus Omnitrophota bacterium]|nr:MAG: UDP-N-acetylmuramate--L-alanine ligase [Candidatus Omnitrophota bacterium]
MEKILSGVKNIYLIGIGGIGMSGLAHLLKDRGFNIKGSDICDSSYVKMVREAGIEVFIGHNKENITQDIDLVGYSSAVKEDNPEILQARRRGITVLKRAELLGLLSWDRKIIAVAGSHGKTTTTSLIGYLLTSLGYQPAMFVGGFPLNYARNAWWGKDYFVIETDESDASFLYYNPWVSIITNIDYEHLDHHKTMENLRDSFLKFAYQTKEKVFGWGECLFVRQIISEVGGWSFGWGKDNKVSGRNFRFEKGMSNFDLFVDEEFIAPVSTHLLGESNATNILAAFSFFHFIGQDLEKVSRLLEKFKGIKRRFQIKGEVAGVVFVDDYAHHPTEIRAVLKAARYLKPKRVVVICQPHRFSRLKLLYEEFLRCFSLADELIITDIYSASEKETPEVNVEVFRDNIAKDFNGRVRYIASQSLAQQVPSYLREGDLCLGIGAGNINVLMDEIMVEVKDRKQRILTK